MRRVITLIASLLGMVGLMALPTTAGAASPAFALTPFAFVGAANDCFPGSLPGTDTITAKWDNSTGNPAPSILLAKIGPTTDCSAAGVEITGTPVIGGPASGLTELNFDYNTAGHCGAGAPRFNIVSGSKVAFLGCLLGGTRTDLGNGWTHVEFSSSDITAAETLAGILPTDTISELQIIFDEGTDITGQGTPGTVNIDNVSLNGAVVGSPTSPQTKDDCKNGGWQNFTPAFKNQGDCVSFVATGGKNGPFTPKH